jgi:hypothetical protein
MFLDAEEIFRQKQFLKKNKKAARELALFNQKLDIKKQKENINKKIKQSLIKKNKINIQNDLIFQHSINTENELIEYIASIKSRMYKNDLNSVNKNIKNIYLDIIKNINKFQEFKKEQFNITQKEIEAKTLEIFRIKEKQEKEILLNKIKENENVFQKMENEKNEIALIKDDFKHANNVYDFHVNKFEELRLSKEVLIMENKGLEKLIKELKNKQKNLINKFNIKFNTNLNEKQIEKLNEIDFSDLIEENNNNNKEENVYVTEEILNEKDFDENNENNSLIENLKFNLNNNNKEKNFNNKSKNLSNISIKTNANTNKTYLNLIEKIERNSDYLNKIILSLTEENKKIKNEFSSILFKHSMMNRNKNNLKILIEKCIEDINYEYKNLKEKFKFNINKNLIPKNIPKLKKVENELYLLSYIHDNCLEGKKILIRNNSLIMTKNYPNKIKRLFSAKI